MIITFTIENWMSFKDEVSFSMVASREKQHGHRIPRVKKFPVRILPVTALYGGNASGKSNFFKALEFAKNLVVEGTKPDEMIPVEPFLLDDDCLEKPSRFKFELLINELIYEFSFSVTRDAVVEEKLVEINSTKEKILYSRKGKKYKINVSEKGKRKDFLKYVSEGTDNKQLFLTNSISQNVDKFRLVYNWFRDILTLVGPSTKVGSHYSTNEYISDLMGSMLERLDTGISTLAVEEIKIDQLGRSDVENRRLFKYLENNSDSIIFSKLGCTLNIEGEEAYLTTKRRVALHKKANGTTIKFEIDKESDGSQRVIDLLPMFMQISPSDFNKVYIIDEIDRSLHTLLTRQLLEFYLDNCSEKSRSQLLFTTHDVLLMDQDLLRRDEMWVAERDNEGSSDIVSLGEYKDIRNDKDIRKSYLQGRFGGVPRILLNSSIINQQETD